MPRALTGLQLALPRKKVVLRAKMGSNDAITPQLVIPSKELPSLVLSGSKLKFCGEA